MVQCDLVWLDHAPVDQSPRTILKHQLERVAERGLRRARRHRARVHRLRHAYEEAHDAALPRPDAGQPVQRRLLDPRHDAGGAAAARHPQHDVRRGPRRRGRQGRVQLRPARDRLPLRRRAGHRRQPQRLQDRRPRRSPPQHGKAITFMAKFNEREGNSCHIHLSLRGDDGKVGLLGRRCRRDRRSTTTSSPVCSRRCRLHAALRAEHQLLQALRRRFVRPDHDRVGARQPDLRGAPGRARAVRADGEPPSRRRRQPLPRAGCDAGRRAPRHRARLELEDEDRQRLQLRQARCRTPCRRTRRVPDSKLARGVFGDEVVDHYTNMADVELAAFGAAVTDWELARGFERM